MLKDSFYSVEKRNSSPGQLNASIIINDKHPIFAGHFPKQPVVPGVCMIQIVKEFLEAQTQTHLRLTEADNIKFLSVIDPRINKSVEVAVSYTEMSGKISINASLFSGSVTFFKLKATLQHIG